MRKLFIACILFCVSVGAFAQKGLIKGTVKDIETGEEIIGANVFIEGTTTGSATDVFGNFQFSVNEGTYNLIATFIGYANFKITDLVVKPGEEVNLTIQMQTDNVQLQEVVVTAKADRTSEQVLLLERRKSSVAIENIGASELSAKGVSDVASGLVKMAGISKVSSRGVYVRGLGDRYNNAYLNSLPLPSPDPNKKMIDLEMFPTAIVRNIGVSKTYRVDQFGDMSGASVDIFTKDPAEEDFLSVGFGFNYNSNSTFNTFNTIDKGGSYYFGIEKDSRNDPNVIRTLSGFQFEKADGNPFNAGYGQKQINAPLDNSYNVEGGKYFEFDKSKLGLIFSGSFKNSYRQDQGINNILNKDQIADRDFYRERDMYTANLTGLLGLQYSIGEKHNIGVNYLAINSTENGFITSQGDTDEQDQRDQIDLRRIRARYVETRLNDIQLNVSNTLTDNLKFKWGGSFAQTVTDEPDRVDLSFTTAQNDFSFGQLNSGVGGENQRYFQETLEDELYGFGEFIYSFGSLSEEGESPFKIYAGYQRRDKNRGIGFKSYQLDVADSPINGQIVPLNNLNYIFSQASGSYNIVIEGSNFSEANRSINAFYLYGDINITNKLKVIPGARLELTNQEVLFRLEGSAINAPYNIIDMSDADILPSLNIKYDLSENNIVRIGASKTLTRPKFQELIPVAFQNENLQSITGNPRLVNSEVTNIDLKFETFPRRGELISVGAYYKYIDKPIEQVRSGVNFISFFNMSEANVYGLELEFIKRVANIIPSSSRFVEGLTIDGNMSILYSEVSTKNLDPYTEALLTNVTNDKRALQGASPYLFNISLGYDNELFTNSRSSNIQLTYNIFGDRIYTAGTNNSGDEFEKSYGSLDLVLQNTWNNGLGIKLSAKNLLNPEINMEQEAGPDTSNPNVVTQSYRAGLNLGLSVTYNVFRY